MRTSSFLTFGSGSLSAISIRNFKSSQRPSKHVKSTKASNAQSLTSKKINIITIIIDKKYSRLYSNQ